MVLKKLIHFSGLIITTAAFLTGCANTGVLLPPHQTIPQGTAQPSSNLFGSYHGASTVAEVYFDVIRVAGDGDCAFHSLDLNRANFVNELRSHIDEPHYQDLIREDVFDALRVKDENVKDPWTDLTLDRFNEYVETILPERTEYLSFTMQQDLAHQARPNLDQAHPTASRGTLPAAAELFNLNVRIWEQIDSSDPKRLHLVAKIVTEPKGTAFYDVLYTGRGHFDKLTLKLMIPYTEQN